jgi:hypothetical protein
MDAQIQAAIDNAVATARAALQLQLNAANTDLAAARTELTAAQAEIIVLQRAVAAAPPAVAAAPATPVQFAYSPATVSNDIIDYKTPAGIKVYKLAGEKLKSDFDLDSNKFTLFLDNLNTKCSEQGWIKPLLTIPFQGNDLYMLRHYGSLSYASVLQQVHSYAFRECRLAQDSKNLLNCLESSLSDDARTTVYAERKNYTIKRGDVDASQALIAAAIPVPAGDADDEIRDGVLFLWSIINRTTAKTNATISGIIFSLTHLDNIMAEHHNDITSFNTHVRTLLNQYVANRQSEYDQTILIDSLFQAYKTTKDNEFTQYITRKQEDHDDHSILLNAEQLMEHAMKLYTTKMQRKTWEQDSTEHREILNLSAQLQASQKEISEMKKRFTEKKTDRKSSNNKDSNQQQQRLPPDEYRKQKRDKAPSWMKRKPKNLNKTLTRDNKTFWWCSKHRMWQTHKTVDCRIPDKTGNDDNKKNSNAGLGSQNIQSNKNEQQQQATNEKPKMQLQSGPSTSMVLSAEWESDY